MLDEIKIKAVEVARQKLSNDVWITRKNHINASERLLKSASYVEFINVYYSIVLILFSLLSVSPFFDSRPQVNLYISYMSIAGSVALTVSIIFANSLCYRERAQKFKENYIRMQLLLAKLDKSQKIDETQLFKLQEEYIKLLTEVENHEYIDYLKLLHTGEVENRTMSRKAQSYYYFYYVWHWFWKILLVILPVIGLFILVG